MARTAGGSNNTLIFIDCRSKVAAMGNAVMGKGVEDMSNYPHCKLYFRDIGNIHDMRSSLNDLANIILSTSGNPYSPTLSP